MMREYDKSFAANPTNHVWQPDYIASAVSDIDFEALGKRGITTLFIDLDGTVVERAQYAVSPAVVSALQSQELDIYIATNRPVKRDLRDLLELLSAKGVVHPKGVLGKPFPSYYRNALKRFNLKQSEVAMVGDRFLQDIWGANAAGLTTVLVRKQDHPTNWFDRLLSGAESRYVDQLLRRFKAD